MAKNNYPTPKSKLFYNRYVKNFNPYNPSDNLLGVLNESRLPKSGYLNKETRGLLISEIDIEQASYIGYSCEKISEEFRLLGKIKYFIEMAKDNTITKVEMQELLSDKEVGLFIDSEDKEEPMRIMTEDEKNKEKLRNKIF